MPAIHYFESPRTMYPDTVAVYRFGGKPGSVWKVSWTEATCDSYTAIVSQVGYPPIVVPCPTGNDLDALLMSIAEDEGWEG